MSITTAICNSFKKECLEGLHQPGDTYKMALFTASASLSKHTTAYSTTNEVAGAGYTAGGATLSDYASGLAADTAYLDWGDPAWMAATITAAGCMIYNASRSDKAVAVYDFGGNVTSTAGTFTVTMPEPKAATAAVRIA